MNNLTRINAKAEVITYDWKPHSGTDFALEIDFEKVGTKKITASFVELC